MDRRKRDSITIESPSNKDVNEKQKKSINSIKNEELYLIDEAYGKLNEHPSPKHTNRNNIDEISRNKDEISRNKDEISRTKDEISRNKDEISRNIDEISRNIDENSISNKPSNDINEWINM